MNSFMLLPHFLGELSHKSALFCLHVEKLLQKYCNIRGSQGFLLALSGGCDSTCLALVMSVLSKRNNFLLAAAHVNHQLRNEAAGDASFVQDLCSGLNIPCEIIDFPVQVFARENKLGLEEAGRIVRKSLLEERARITGYDIITAHHLDDLGEDILLRLIRGVGWPALGGMRIRSGFYLRPFLYLAKKDIRDFLIRENVQWREDSSNGSRDFRRNRIRQDILPLLKMENPALGKSVMNVNQFAEIDRIYWLKELESFFAGLRLESGNGNVFLRIPREHILKNKQALRLRVYHHALKMMANINQSSAQGRAETLFRIDRALTEFNGDKSFHLSGQIFVNVSGKELVFKTFAVQENSRS